METRELKKIAFQNFKKTQTSETFEVDFFQMIQ